MKILIFADQRSGAVKSSTWELCSLASSLESSPENIAAVVVGKGVASNCGDFAGQGLDKVFVVEDDQLELYNPVSYSKAIELAVEAFSPDLILASASPMGKDVLPRLAARFDSALFTDVISLSHSGDELEAQKPMYAGKAIATLKAKTSSTCLVSLRPNSIEVKKPGTGLGTVETINWSSLDTKIQALELKAGASQKADLTEASRIISGGRAMGSADAFKILDEAAAAMEATVGASRAAVDSGYASHDMQVGQTGKTVNPNLYIACGISGSIQHMAGMRTAKTIVAINTDPDAPIFKIADYGIVADLFEAVPVLTEKLKALNS
ncbi:MAG: electron transfer flavoprotein subunit alpha/FixB family protein [Pseudobacteriovorax sp.]|nr:electron transfer flavoprotein subunit alpha/FixB family protein [Pseudobacteriovorax sp.]